MASLNQMEVLQGTGSNENQGQGDTIFTNQAILLEILRHGSALEIRKWRQINKNCNVVVSDLMNVRESKVKKFERSEDMTTFLDTMENRLTNTVPYSVYVIVLSRFSSEALIRFGLALTDHVRKLDLNLNYVLYKDYGRTRNPIPDAGPNTTKNKALLLLSYFPNIAELSLKYDEGARQNFLSSEELQNLPTFPRLLDFKFEQSGLDGIQQGPVPLPIMNTFMTAIIRRSPILRSIENRHFSTLLSPSLESLPAILREFSSPPALTIDTILCLVGDAMTQHPSHIMFLRNLITIGFYNLRSLCLSIDSPVSNVLAEMNRFIAFQAHALESLTIYAEGPLDPNTEEPLTLPLMPNLTNLVLNLDRWPLSRVLPNPLTMAHFPQFNDFTLNEYMNDSEDPEPFDTKIFGRRG